MSWGTMLTNLSSPGRTLAEMDPLSGLIVPARTLTRVDLPAPFSPTTPCTRPGVIARSRSCNAITPGTHLVTPRSSISGWVAVAIGTPIRGSAFFDQLIVGDRCRSPRP